MEGKEKVIPGDRVATEEEYIPAENAMAIEGTLYTTVVGTPVFEEGKAKVEPQSGIYKYKKGMMVLGTIVGDLKSVLFVDIDEFKIGGKRFVAIKDGKIILPKPRDGRDSGRYGQEPARPCASSDVILARIFAEDNDSYMLSFRDEGTGVVFARCEKCNGEMLPSDGSAHCKVCDYRTRKKISSIYGDVEKITALIKDSIENIGSYNEQAREMHHERRPGNFRERGDGRDRRDGRDGHRPYQRGEGRGGWNRHRYEEKNE